MSVEKGGGFLVKDIFSANYGWIDHVCLKALTWSKDFESARCIIAGRHLCKYKREN